jgi:hypothetical protein
MRSNKAKMQGVFEILLQGLKMLGREKHALRPNDAMAIFHDN